MVLKAAVVFIAGGLTGSGIVALTGSLGDGPAASESEIAAPVSAADTTTNFPGTWIDVPQARDQHYIHARFAAQRPFAALHPVRR